MRPQPKTSASSLRESAALRCARVLVPLGLFVAVPSCDGGQPARAAVSVADGGETDAQGRLARRVAELEAEREALLAALEASADELAGERARRLEREEEWLLFTRAVSELEVASDGALPAFGPHLPEVEAPPPERPDPALMSPGERARVERAAAVLTSLRALLFQSGVHSLDLLELGRVNDGWCGPVVFRSLDERGRLAGSLFAERLRLQASRAGRTLTLILEDGHESHGGVRTPFGALDAGEGPRAWRITLADVDPDPWLEALPELFVDSPPEELLDDGGWDLDYVRAKLNQLLREDTQTAWFRLRRLGGVREGVLRDVHLEQLDGEGRVHSRLFADRLLLAPATSGVVLVLEDGVRMRGDEKTPFLDGRQRLFLPRARRALWQEAGLPGFVDGPAGPAAASSSRR